MTDNKQALSEYPKLGWKIFPVHSVDEDANCTCNRPHAEPKDAGKHPAIGEWNVRATSNADTINGWWDTNNNYNIGVFCQPSGFFVIDVDPRSGGVESFEKFEELLEYCLPETVMAYTGVYIREGKPVRGRHYYFKVNPDEKLIGKLDALGLKGIDIKHNGYVVTAPSMHFSGVNYEWVEGHAPWEIDMAEAPIKLLAAIRKSGTKKPEVSGSYWANLASIAAPVDRVDIAKMLEEGIEEGSRAVDIYKLACALANKNGVETPEKRLMIETMMMRFNFEKVKPPMELEGPNSLLMHVRRAMDFVAENPIGTKGALQEVGGPEYLHDASVVEWLIPKLETQFCWNSNRGWSQYSDGYWNQVSAAEVREFLRVFLQEFWVTAKSRIHDPAVITSMSKLVSARSINTYEEALRGGLFVSNDKFDQQLDLLNVKNGVVDLRTKELLPHSSGYRFTKVTPIDYTPNANHPDWLKALGAIPESAHQWVQAFFGQACSARTANDDYIAVFSGGGRNGKSTIVQVARVVLGDYATAVSDKVLTARTNDHSTDLTDLRGRRLAILEEFPDAVPLNGKRLKEISGTAVITARRMRENNESWKPTHTFIITTNHEIRLAAGDDGTWRRLVPIRFPFRYVQSPSKDFDKPLESNLRERLLDGREGQHRAVLAWMVEGAFQWYQNGCRMPAIPKTSIDSLEEWRMGQDVIGAYIAERIKLESGSSISMADVHADFKRLNPHEETFIDFARFNSAFISHEFVVTNGLERRRVRTAGLKLSRPKHTALNEVRVHESCIRGLSFF
jgi:putative DNA primase/helicase